MAETGVSLPEALKAKLAAISDRDKQLAADRARFTVDPSANGSSKLLAEFDDAFSAEDPLPVADRVVELYAQKVRRQNTSNTVLTEQQRAQGK